MHTGQVLDRHQVNHGCCSQLVLVRCHLDFPGQFRALAKSGEVWTQNAALQPNL